MAIIRWDPFREMTQVQDQVSRLFDQVWGGRQESWLPAVDVFDQKDAVVVKAELAGMDPNDIQIEVEDNVLTIKGERRFEEKVDDERYYRVERRYGSFQRALALPQGVKADEISAAYEDGILTVTVVDDQTAQPIAGATVLVAERDGTPHTAITGADGRYRIEGVPPGEYVPAAVAPGYGEAALAAAAGSWLRC